MGPTREFLQDDMVLRVAVAEKHHPDLDPMTGMVLRCAKELKTVAQTVEAIGLGRDITCRMILELLSQKIITISNNQNAGKKRSPSPRKAPEGNATPRTETNGNSERATDSYFEELRRLHTACQKANYYEILGIYPETKRTEMRTRYFALSKRFHPDKAFGKVDASQKQIMSTVFQKLTEAYDTLSNPKRRRKYDESLGEKLEIWAMEAKLKRAMSGSETGGENSTSPHPSAPAANPSASPERDVTTSASSSPPGKAKFIPSMPPSQSVESRRQVILRRRAGRAMADILRRRTDSPGAPNVEVQRSLVDEAQKAMKNRGYKEAMEYLKKALEITPGDKKTQELFETAMLEHKRAQAQAHLRRGRYAKSAGELEQALWHFKQALCSDKDSLDTRHHIAELMVEQKSNLDKALAYMREIIVLGGQKARYFVTLGDIFLLLKEVDRATDAFNKALTMEPNNKDIKKRLRNCKK